MEYLDNESPIDMIRAHSDAESTQESCLANIGDDGYEPCGEHLRRRRNGVTWCPTHGEMH